jgi:hypothetical protein
MVRTHCRSTGAYHYRYDPYRYESHFENLQSNAEAVAVKPFTLQTPSVQTVLERSENFSRCHSPLGDFL